MKKQRNAAPICTLLGLGAVIALAVVIIGGHGFPKASAESGTTPENPPVVISTATPDPTPEPTPVPTETPAPTATPTPAVTPTAAPEAEKLMDSIAKALGNGREDEVPAMLDELEAVDPGRAEDWRILTDYWLESAKEGFVGGEQLPDDLPQDNSLCLVVFGYQLTPAGKIKSELEARLKVALACANQYPNAYILVTGGGTAEKNKDATEAGLMASWLRKNGIAKERILKEDDSVSTGENIKYSYTLLSRHPEITSVAVITSDYHVRRCCVLFTARFLMKGSPLKVVANASCSMGKHTRENLKTVASSMASLYGVK